MLSATMTIQSHRGPYTVSFGTAFEGLQAGLAETEHMIIDSRVAELYAGPLGNALSRASTLRIQATEENKSLERIPDFVTHLIDHRIRRDHVLVAVGGGIIQDITAFIAATLLRGLRWRFYPTTLLAQADSCIGSKTSINVGSYKNQLGTFTPPEEVCISTALLDTLDPVDLRSGVGEMLKIHIISGWDDTRAISSDYDRILEDRAVMEKYIWHSLELKKAKIEADEFDRGERLVMNYGHSFGHAIESATNYLIPHGIAVTMGADLANYVSCRLGFAARSTFDELHALLQRNFSGFERTSIPEDVFFDALGRDKKNLDNDLSLILMKEPGQVFRGRYRNDDRFKGICRDYLLTVGTGLVHG